MAVLTRLLLALCGAVQLLHVAAAPTATSTHSEFELEGLRKTHRVSIPHDLLPAPVAYHHALSKYQLPIDEEVLLANSSTTLVVAAKDTTSVTAMKDNMASVTVGSQELKLNFDTGSTDLWVFSDMMPLVQRLGHTAYNLGGHLLEGNWSMAYGSGKDSAYPNTEPESSS